LDVDGAYLLLDEPFLHLLFRNLLPPGIGEFLEPLFHGSELVAADDAEEPLFFEPAEARCFGLGDPVGPARVMLDEVDLSRDELQAPGIADTSSPQVLERLQGCGQEGFDLEANQIWLWGQGFQPQVPSFAETHGVEAGLVTAVDLVRGIGVLSGMKVCDIPGATGWFDTDYEGKRDIALVELEAGLDLFVIHVEATDEAGHAGNVAEKVRALENWDSRILAGLIPGLDSMGAWRLLMLPDHATPLTTRTHTADPVPYVLVDSAVDGPGGVFSESGVVAEPLVPGYQLVPRLLAG